MNASQVWGGLLIAAALVAFVLQVRSWRAQRITTLQFAAGLIARAGFVLLGVIYAADLADRWRRAPMYGLAIVGFGIVLNLAAGILANFQRHRQ